MAAAQGGQALPVLEVHTDGSVSRPPNGPEIGRPAPSGCAFVARSDNQSPWIGRFYALGWEEDSRHAELMGIYLALQYYVEEAREAGRCYREIWIHSDCGRAVHGLRVARNASGVAERLVTAWIVEYIAELQEDFATTVRLIIVQGHAGVPGNVEADSGASCGALNSRHHFVGLGWWYGAGSVPDTFDIQWPWSW